MNAVTRLRLRPVARSSPYARFTMHRQKMLGAFAEWVTDPEDHPLQADVAAEVAATAGAIRQIGELMRWGRNQE